MKIVQFTSQLTEEWDAFVGASKNGTFLLERRFMDFRADHFSDCSLMLYEDTQLVALFPANWDEEGRVVYSHQGLPYGGLVLGTETTERQVLEMLQQILLWCLDYLQAERVVYKPIPYIYSDYASEEDLYALFRAGAKLQSRALSSVVAMRNPLRMRKQRVQGAKRAIDNGLYIDRLTDGDWTTLAAFWQLLMEMRARNHRAAPAQSLEDVQLLMSRFPLQIKLFLVRREKEVMAGCVVFVTSHVAHIRYIVASDEGREMGALDLLFRHLLNERFKQIDYVDFGLSTEMGGQYLNEGMLFQKEGFGARAVCYDTYEIVLDSAVVSQMLPVEERSDELIRFRDLKRENASFEPKLSESLLTIVRSGCYVQGAQVRNFEHHFAAYTCSRHCILCGSGKEALILILRACKQLNWWQDDSEIIVPANVCIDTILAVREAGLCPVLCEPSMDDYLLDQRLLAGLMTARTVAVLPVHLYGRICDMRAINAFADEHHLLVIEDATQAHGAMQNDCHAGHLGHAAAFSFSPSANLCSVGHAGCVTTDDDTLADLVRLNARADELHAAVLDVKLPRLDADNERRRWIARRYIEGIGNPLITLPMLPKDEREHVFNVFPVRTGYRSELMKRLKEQGIETSVHYPVPPHRRQELAEFAGLSLPVTELLHREEVSLPVSPLMTNREVERVVEAVNLFNV